ncbi:MAG: hypothetical protein HYV33_02730 [Candidatus Kerfeldbacteria bacterium]|nr:hypothetical protein [Candidatus Kerfeldbacteria bacterium]
MALNNLSGATFKKLVQKATGTRGYLSSSVQKSLRSDNNQKYLNHGSTITRKQATKVIKALKDQGLAHKVTSDSTKYVKTAFAKEERRQENIKRQNVADRAQAIAAEHTTPTPVASNKKSGYQLAQAAAPIDTTRSSSDPVTSSFGSTNLKSIQQLPPAVTKPKDWEEQEKNIIDLAID